MPKIDLDAIPQVNRTGYPAPFDTPIAGRHYRRLSPATGLTEFGASHVVLQPGGWSSQRHWHRGEDEFLVMVSGEAVLVEDGGETILTAGDCAAWPKGVEDGHHLQNRSNADVVFVVIGAGRNEGGAYSDIDMMFDASGAYLHKDGRPYPAKRVP